MHYLNLAVEHVPEPQNLKNKKHWGRRADEAEEWRMRIMAALRSRKPFAQKPAKPLERVQISITRHSHRMLDFDGMVGSFKPVVDALVKNGVLVDDSWAVTGPWFVDQKFRPKKAGQLLEIIVEEKPHVENQTEPGLLG